METKPKISVQDHISTHSDAEHQALDLEAEHIISTQFYNITQLFKSHDLMRTIHKNPNFPGYPKNAPA